MLIEIKNKNFKEGKITFSKGLNTVLGDNHASNSIGKSTLLMIIDFVFGGDSFLIKDSDTIKELGHQTFNFYFYFDNTNYYYSRDTENPDIIFNCNKDYKRINDIKIGDFLKELKSLYKIDLILSFRSIVSLYSRVWGKENNNVDKPLQSFLKQPEKDSVDTLIKLFNLYDSISELNQKIKNKTETKKAIDSIHKQNFVSKITKTEYNKNNIELESINSSIESIKDNLLKFTVNVEELTSKELIVLKVNKSQLVKKQAEIQNKIERINLNLSKKSVKSKYFKKLSEFIPSTNEDKIEKIEEFHNKLSDILNKELLSSKESLEIELSIYNSEIETLNQKINHILDNVESPKYIIDKLHDLTIEEQNIKRKNKYYIEKIDIATEIKSLNTNAEESMTTILQKIQNQINNELIRINEKIHSKDKKVPYLSLKVNSYSFNHSGDDGTGKSYSDLIEFDLSILKLTELPFLIHDSPFFKNIGDLVMEKIIEFYNTFDKQIFISIDGINRYSKQTQDILMDKKVIQLKENHQLFNKDWRKI